MMSKVCFADHWVYIRLKDRSGITVEQDKGRSKEGDIVDIRYADYEPSDMEKAEYAIVKVSGLTDGIISKYIQIWEAYDETTPNDVDQYLPKAYRKYKLKNNWVRNLSKGIFHQIINVSVINGNIRLKNDGDLALYEGKRKVYAALRPARKIYKYVEYAWQYWVRPAYAAVACADDSTSGEQICTVNKTSQDYDTLTLWEDAKDGDLVTATQIRTAELYDDDGDLDDGVSMSGATTSSSYYMKITAPSAERHDGTANSGATLAPTTAETGIDISSWHTIVEWIEINPQEGTGETGVNFSARFLEGAIVRNCLIYSDGSSSVGNGFNVARDGHFEVYNNIVYGFRVTKYTRGSCVSGSYAPDVAIFYNNTFYGCWNGIANITTAGLYTLKNNIVNEMDAIYYDGETFNANSTNNITETANAEMDWGVQADTGTADATEANKLHDADNNFLTTIKLGMIVKNTTDTTFSYVTAIVDDGELTLNDDIMADTETFIIWTNYVSDVAFETAGSDFHLAGIGLAVDGGADLGTTDEVNIDIDGRDRDAEADTWDMGADEFVAAPPEPPETPVTRRRIMTF